jgi:hypothetical protein
MKGRKLVLRCREDPQFDSGDLVGATCCRETAIHFLDCGLGVVQPLKNCDHLSLHRRPLFGEQLGYGLRFVLDSNALCIERRCGLRHFDFGEPPRKFSLRCDRAIAIADGGLQYLVRLVEGRFGSVEKKARPMPFCSADGGFQGGDVDRSQRRAQI